MKASELRIGNLVLIGGIMTELCIILSVQEKLIGYDAPTRKGECNIDLIESIPLTEEWLIKLGFEYHKHQNNMFFISGMQIWVCNDLIMCNKNGIIIKHVHQLQNLYFALTNEELTIK